MSTTRGSDMGLARELSEHPGNPSPVADWTRLSRALSDAELAIGEERERHFAAAYEAAGENASARALIEETKRELGAA